MSGIQPRATRRGTRLDWVKFDFELARDGSVDPTDKALYAAIASFVDVESRESPETGDVDLNGIPEDVPTRKRLAQCIGRSMDTVDRSTKRLEDRRLLKVHRQADPENPKLNLPSEYELLDHELWDERAAARAARRAARRQTSEGDSPGEGGSRTDAATPGRVHAATPGRTGAAVKDQREVEEERGEGEEAVSPRSGGDGRRPSDRSSACAREGGFAASGKTSPSPTPNDNTCGPARGQKSGSKKAAHTREQLDVVRRVRALFPRELLDAEGGLPDVPTLSSAILTAMGEGRTVEQMGERIWYRWSNHGFADQWAEFGRFEKPVGVAVALVRPLRRGDRFACPDLRCENGASLDTGALCQLCAERIADWKAEQARKYGPKPPGGANSRAGGTDSPDAPVPPQRAVQPFVELRSTESWAAQARAEKEAREKGECDGRDGMCGQLLAPGRTLCRDCEDEATEQNLLENKGLPAPF
ncbi:hypothetical protein [Streptomyces sp. NPDC059802]|uniref:hypothetical protein n=1 Tax=Streptomyces sp. NPDC059802 TaxID=3346952 RepID=UPI003662C7CD